MAAASAGLLRAERSQHEPDDGETQTIPCLEFDREERIAAGQRAAATSSNHS
jgi:hypothetical protein